MQDPADIFDLDNVLIDTERLKADMPGLCQLEFPQISPRLFTDVYEGYKAEHEGRVNMPLILRTIGMEAGLTQPERDLLKIWPDQLPYREYLFDPDHRLIKSLGLENVFILTLGDDGYQPVKISGLGFPPYLAAHGHIRITDRKGKDEIASFITELRQRGFTKFRFVNDNITQLRDTYELAPDDVIPVLFRYGPYSDESRLGGQVFPHRVAGDFARLWQILSPENVMLESRVMRPSGERK